MRGYIKTVLGKTKDKEGFTLIELLVVIGIIVALAAITVPLVTKFAGKGDEGALKVETETIQSAMNAMMADKGIVAVTANDKGTTSNGQNIITAQRDNSRGYMEINNAVTITLFVIFWRYS